MRSSLVAWSLAGLAILGVGAVLLAGVGLAHDPGTVHVTVWAHEYHFETNRTDGENPDFELERGATYEIKLVNNGSSPHSFYMADPVNEGTQTIDQGEQTTKTVDVPWDAPDTTFDYFCTVSGHRDLGMEGPGSFHGGNTAPDLSVSQPSEDAQVQGDVTVAGDVLDDEDGADEVTVEVKAPPSDTWEGAAVDSEAGWSFTWNSTAVDDGEHTLEVRAFDHHGLAVHANRTVQVVNDQNAAPSISVETPSAGAKVRGQVPVAGSAEDPEGALSAVEVKLPPDDAWQEASGLENWSVTWDASGLDPGDYVLEARAVDAEGAQETVSHPLRVVNESANRGPRLTISQPAPGDEVRGETRVVGEATDPDGDGVQVEVRDPASTGWEAAVGPGPDDEWSHAWNASGLEAGTYTIQVRASDGKVLTWQNVTVEVPEDENRAPTLSFVSPAEGAELRPPVTVVVAADDVDPDDAVESVRVRLDASGTFRQADPRSGDRWRVRLPGEDVTPGPARITAEASDGEEAVQASREVRIAAPEASPAPTVNVTSPPPDRAEGLVVVAGVVEDPKVQSPPLVVELRVDGDLADLVETPGPGSFTLSWQARRADDGVHDVAVVARDGIASSEVTFAVRVGPDPSAESAGVADELPAPAPGLPLLVLAGAGAAAGRRGLRGRRR